MQLSIVSLVLLGVSLGLASPSGLSDVRLERGNCPVSWFSFNSHCYKYMDTQTTWADAELHCVSQGANLVSIHSLEENTFVKTLIQNHDRSQGATWIGLNEIGQEGGKRWSDGSPVDFTRWNTGEPNNKGGSEQCVHINWGTEKQWNDVKCSYTYPSVCTLRNNCPMSWFSFNGRCYKYVATQTTWADAELYCVSQGANLVSIHSLEEHNFVKTLIQNHDHSQGATWIGLNDLAKEGGWMWSDGYPLDFTRWNTGEPNNRGGSEQCVHINWSTEKQWNDVKCSYTYPSVCTLRITCS